MISAIVLAAGRSRRMGTQKLLLPFAGQTVIGRVVDALLNSPVPHPRASPCWSAWPSAAILGGLPRRDPPPFRRHWSARLAVVAS